MKRLLLGLASFALAVPGAGQAHLTATPLTAIVGDPSNAEAFRITLIDAAGRRVTRLDPGQYDITARDYAQEHNFHLAGPGVDQSTSVGDTTPGTVWSVTLVNGTYRYQCDAHSGLMRGSFRVGAAPPPTPAPTKLNAQVGPGRAISLRTAAGIRAKKLSAGKYRITVRDRSATDNFHLFGAGVDKKTGTRAKTTAVWNVTLSRGVYTYRSDAHPRVRGSVAVVTGSA
jgi:plastocyanin